MMILLTEKGGTLSTNDFMSLYGKNDSSGEITCSLKKRGRWDD